MEDCSEIQIKAINYIMNAFKRNMNPICAIDMGVGKTRVACEVIRKFLLLSEKYGRHYTVLIVHKASSFDNPWLKELQKWGIITNDKQSYRLHGGDRWALFDDYKQQNYPISIIQSSYDTIMNEIDCEEVGGNQIHTKLGEITLTIFDEIHTIINYKKLTKKCMMAIKLNTKFKLALTGTPIQNSNYDLGLTYLFLNQTFILNSYINSKVPEDILDEAVINCLKTNNVFFYLEKTKGNFIKNNVLLLLPTHQEVFNIIRRILVKYPKKKQIYLSHPDSIKYLDLPSPPICTKMEAVKCILSQNKIDKYIIFSQFIDVLYAYNKTLSKMGRNSIVITGKEKGKKLKKKLDLFNNFEEFSVLLTTLQKSSDALNLSIANHVIILELWWNPHKILQAISRIDRKDQNNPIFIYLLCNHENGEMINEEEIIYKTMQKKIKNANNIYTRMHDDSSKEISEEIRELPPEKIFYNIDTLNSDLQTYLNEINDIGILQPIDYPEEELGIPYSETKNNIQYHPMISDKFSQVRINGIEKAIAESNKIGKNNSNTRPPEMEWRG